MEFHTAGSAEDSDIDRIEIVAVEAVRMFDPDHKHHWLDSADEPLRSGGGPQDQELLALASIGTEPGC